MIIRDEEGNCDICGDTQSTTTLLGPVDMFVCAKCFKNLSYAVHQQAAIAVEITLSEKFNDHTKATGK